MAIIDNLISYWKMDEAAGNIIDAHASNDGNAVTGDPTYSQTGKIGTAIVLDGNDSFTIPDSAGLQIDGDMSISMWIYPTAIDGTDALFCKRDGGGTQFQFYIGDDTGFVLRLYDGTNNPTSDKTTTLEDNNWYHIVASVDSGTVTFWINGVDNGGGTSAISANDAPLEVGELGISSWFFTGTMDEIGLWDGPLSSAEVASLYNGGDGLAYPFTTGTNMQINIGDVWKEVPAAQINIGDVWKDIAGMQINIGDSWKEVF